MLIRLLFILFLLTTPLYAGIDFDGTDDGLDCSTGQDITSDLTIAAWIYRNDTSHQQIIGNRNAGGNAGWEYECTGTFNRITWVGVAAYDSNSGACPSGQWVHVAASFDDTANTIDFYSDGVLSVQRTSVGDINTVSEKTWIGHLRGAARPFNGKIADVALWTSALTAQEVAQLALSKGKHMPLQIDPSNLRDYWPLYSISDGVSADGSTLRDLKDTNSCTGVDGANNTGLTGSAEEVLSSP